MFIKNERGFTLKEVTMVFVVTAILCIAVIPVYNMMRSSHRSTEFERALGILQTSLQQWQQRQGGKTVSGPKTLDALESGNICNACFSTIVPTGITSNLWYKKSDSEYYFSMLGKIENISDFEKSGQMLIQYNEAQATFKVSQVP